MLEGGKLHFFTEGGTLASSCSLCIIYLNFMVENYQGSAGYLYQQPNKTYVHTYTLIKLIS